MTTFTRTELFNRTANVIATVDGGDIEAALLETQPNAKDAVELRQVTVELVAQGERRISGSDRFEPRMIQRVTNVTVTQTGTVKVAKRTATVTWATN